jgi:hypothetical protein
LQKLALTVYFFADWDKTGVAVDQYDGDVYGLPFSSLTGPATSVCSGCFPNSRRSPLLLGPPTPNLQQSVRVACSTIHIFSNHFAYVMRGETSDKTCNIICSPWMHAICRHTHGRGANIHASPKIFGVPTGEILLHASISWSKNSPNK